MGKSFEWIECHKSPYDITWLYYFTEPHMAQKCASSCENNTFCIFVKMRISLYESDGEFAAG